jgi:hypothetical protein
MVERGAVSSFWWAPFCTLCTLVHPVCTLETLVCREKGLLGHFSFWVHSDARLPNGLVRHRRHPDDEGRFLVALSVETTFRLGAPQPRAARGPPRRGLRTPPDPLLAAHVDLLLPERHVALGSIDRLLAGCERVPAMGSRDCDRGTGVAHVADADPVRDRNAAEVVFWASCAAISAMTPSAIPS